MFSYNRGNDPRSTNWCPPAECREKKKTIEAPVVVQADPCEVATQSHSTKFFSRQVLLQSFAKAVARTVVAWAPRECHKEADLLADQSGHEEARLEHLPTRI